MYNSQKGILLMARRTTCCSSWDMYGYAESKESAWPGEYERWCQGLALSLLRPPWDVYKCLVLGHDIHTQPAGDEAKLGDSHVEHGEYGSCADCRRTSRVACWWLHQRPRWSKHSRNSCSNMIIVSIISHVLYILKCKNFRLVSFWVSRAVFGQCGAMRSSVCQKQKVLSDCSCYRTLVYPPELRLDESMKYSYYAWKCPGISHIIFWWKV